VLVAHLEEMRNAYRTSLKGMRPLGRPRCRWEDKRIDLEGVDWIYLSVVNMVMKFRLFKRRGTS
jgi:hypothetical protein